MRKVDLSELLEEVTNLGSSCLGPAEYQVLQDASLLLQGGEIEDLWPLMLIQCIEISLRQ
jgi:hypothetical protein